MVIVTNKENSSPMAPTFAGFGRLLIGVSAPPRRVLFRRTEERRIHDISGVLGHRFESGILRTRQAGERAVRIASRSTGVPRWPFQPERGAKEMTIRQQNCLRQRAVARCCPELGAIVCCCLLRGS